MTFLESFFITGDLPPNAAKATYDFSYVLLSYIIASFGSFTSLMLASAMFKAKNRNLKNTFHAGAAAALGAGIWSMHFIGMLSYKMTMVTVYDPLLTIFSMLFAIVMSFLAFSITRRNEFLISHILFSSVLLGLSVCGMHYTGMAAMKMDASLRYIPWIFTLSVVIAIAASGAAITIIYFLGRYEGKWKMPGIVLAALIMGVAVCGMHYTGMAAAIFMPFADCRFDLNQKFDTMALAIGAVTSTIFAIALALLVYNREQASTTDQKKSDAFPAKIVALSLGLTFAFALWLSMEMFDNYNAMTSFAKEVHHYELYVILFALGALSVVWFFSLRGLSRWHKELVAARNAIKMEKTRLSAIMDNMMQSVITINAEGIIQSVNKWAETTFGYATNEMIGNNINLLMPQPHRSLHNQYLRDYLKTGTAKIIGKERELSGVRKDGTEFPLSLCVTEVKIDDSSTFIGLIRDLTEQKQKERELAAQKEKEREMQEARIRAEMASQAKSNFLANMSHEIRTPMNGIIGLIRLLADSNIDPDQRSSVQAILHSSESLLFLLNDILDYSKIEAGELALEISPFNLKGSLQNVVNLLSAMASKKGIVINYQYDKNAPTSVNGDATRIGQIITNLVGNALKFTEKGSVTLSVSAETGSQPDDYLFRIEIKDTGVGIPQHVHEQLFKKFAQGDSSTRRKFGGTGLGLAISKSLAEQMKGSISFASESGKGSTFTVLIPMKKSDREIAWDNRAREGLNLQRSAKDFSRFRLLVVDDHPVNMLFARKLLKKMGFTRIDEATNGLEALQKIESAEKQYDMVLMDCQMPEMDGFEACQKIREREQRENLPRLPVAAMTAHAMEGDRDLCVKAGMDDYISKPVNPDKLHDVLSYWLLKGKESSAETEELSPEKAASVVSAPRVSLDESDKPLIDLKHLELFTDGDLDQEKMLVDIFLSVSETSLKTLKDNINEGDKGDNWKNASHKLKGSSAQIGAATLSALCLKAKQGYLLPAEEKKVLLGEIESGLKKVKLYFELRQRGS